MIEIDLDDFAGVRADIFFGVVEAVANPIEHALINPHAERRHVLNIFFAGNGAAHRVQVNHRPFLKPEVYQLINRLLVDGVNLNGLIVEEIVNHAAAYDNAVMHRPEVVAVIGKLG